MKNGWGGLAILLVLLSQAHGQEIWRQVDGQGAVRYADRPFLGAVRMDPPDAARWLGRPPAASAKRPAPDQPHAPSASWPASDRSPAAAPRRTSALEIAYPPPDETVWGAGGELEIRLAIEDPMEDGVRLSIRLDGEEAAWQGQPPAVRIGKVWRGEHRLRARLLDSAGGVIAASEEVRFFKREPAIPAAGTG